MALGFFRYHTLKQILPQLELFETGFDDELKWLDEASVALDAYKHVNTLEEVERELGRHTVGRVLSRVYSIFKDTQSASSSFFKI